MRLSELLLENWSLKLTAVLLASFLWLMVRGDPNAERVISVPLEVRVPRNMEITSERPISVDVTVRGASPNMWFGQILPTYIVDMQAYDAGEHVVQLSPENVRFPRASGLEAVAVRPVRLKLTLERTIAKEVPVRLATRGEPEAGIEIYGTYVSPATVVLSGPRSGIEPIKEVSTEIVSLTGQRQSFRAFVNLDIRHDAVHSAPPGPIEVNIQLGPPRKIQRVTGIPVAADDERAIIVPPVITALVLVPVTVEKALTPLDFIASVTTASLDLSKSDAKVRPEIRLRGQVDPGIAIKAIQPPEITVRRK